MDEKNECSNLPESKSASESSRNLTMDALLGTLSKAQNRLRDAGIQNAVIGGLAVAARERPRLTDDIDLKVSADRSQVAHLIEIMAPDFLPAEDAIEAARVLGILFLDGPEGIPLDLLLADMGFDHQVLERAVDAEIVPGFRARLCTAEDLILYKMITTRPRDREDAQSVVREQGQALDRAYIEHWLRQFELALDDSTLLEAFQRML